MTYMRPHMNSLHPTPSEQDSAEAHKVRVIAEHAPLFGLIERALRDSAAKARDFFLLVDGLVDLSVHAAWTRYLCKKYLASQNVVAADEEESPFEIGRIPNCGLCLNGTKTQLRILKAGISGIPKASSDARSRFYCSNQYLLPFDAPNRSVSPPDTPLSLIVLWFLDSEFQFKGMEIACPKGEREDGGVECHWITDWQGDRGSSSVDPVSPISSGPDLDEIRAIQQNRKATS